MDSLSALPHRSLNDAIKLNIFNTVKQIKTVAEFINKVCLIKEHAATQLLAAIENFKRRGNEFKKDSRSTLGSVHNTWEAILLDTEDEARELLELSQKLVNSVCVPLIDQSSKKKAILKKILGNRECLETQLDKNEEMLAKSFKDYADSWTKYQLHKQDPQKEQHLSIICFNSHNDYVSHLAGFNRTNEVIYKTIIPEMLTDAQTSISDLGNSYSHLMRQFSQTQQQKLSSRMSKLQSLEDLFGYVNVDSDISQYVQSLGAGEVKIPRKTHENPDTDANVTDILGGSLLLNPLTEPALKRKYYQMNYKASDIVNIIDKDKTALTSLKQLRNSYVENASYGNPDGITEDVVKCDFELKQKRIHFAVLTAQMGLFTKDMIQDMGPMEGSPDADDSDGEGYSKIGESEKQAHKFVSFISKRPAFCAYCKGVLIGIVKPTVRCKVCKLMAHHKCQMNVPYCTGLPEQRTANVKVLASRTTSLDSRSSVALEDVEDSHVYSDINEENISPPKYRSRSHSGSAAEGRGIFINGSYGSSPNLVPSPPEVPTKPTPKKRPEQCLALYDYDAKSPGDLNVKAGQRIILLNGIKSDWWEGSYKGKTGFFPASYALKIKEKDVVLKCLYEFEGEEEDELSIAPGQVTRELALIPDNVYFPPTKFEPYLVTTNVSEILVLIEDEGNGWMVGRGVDGEGIFPSTYVKKI